MTPTLDPRGAADRQAAQPRPADAPEPRSAQRQLWTRARAYMEAQCARSTPNGSRRSYDRLLHEPLHRLIELGLRATGLAARGRRNALDIRLEHRTAVLAGLPEQFDGYRILHLTDPHFDQDERIGEAIVRAVDGVEADLCVLTGDYRAASDGPYAQVLPPIARLRDAIAVRDGICATLGNHDSYQMAEAFEAMGLRVLANETLRIDRGGQFMSVTGLDDVNRYYTPQADMALQATEPFGADHFGLALVHSAEMAAEAAAAGYAMYLCGHTHGGQISLPGGVPVLTNLTRNRGFAAGAWSCGEMAGYTSPGAGVSGVMARFHTRGEVTLFTLRRPDRAARPRGQANSGSLISRVLAGLPNR